MRPSKIAEHNAYQRWYYETGDKHTMRPTGSAYSWRHIRRAVASVGLEPGLPYLEVGAGSGRYSIPMLERGYLPTCLDLSPVLLERLRAQAPHQRFEILSCDLKDLAQRTERRFSRAIGFFTLHHMHDLTQCFQGLAAGLVPGARVAFIEPVATNPLYYLQILLTREMTWQGDKGVMNMRPGPIFSAMSRAGFDDLGAERFGYFPPFLSNTRVGSLIEERFSDRKRLAPFNAFYLFSGRRR